MIQPLGRYLRAGVFGILLGVVVSFSSQFWDNLPQKGEIVQRNGKVLGGDFITFYVAGRLFEEHRGSLYDLEFQRTARQTFLAEHQITESLELPFVYPILLAGLFSLFAKLPFVSAFFVWSSSCLLISGVSFFALLKELGLISVRQIPLFFLLILGFAPFGINTLMGGQLSAIGIALFSALFLLLNRQHFGLAGFVFSFSYYKPPLFLICLVCLVLTQPRRFFGGFLAGATSLIGLSVLVGGVSGMIAYFEAASRYVYGRDVLPGVQLPPGQGAGVFGALVQIVPSPFLSGLILLFLYVAFIWSYVRLSRRRGCPNRFIMYALMTCATVGLSVQCIRYDLAILLVPFALIAKFQHTLPLFYRVVLVGIVVAFYGEFCFREMPMGKGFFNLSSFLFLPLIGILWVIASQNVFSFEREKEDVSRVG